MKKRAAVAEEALKAAFAPFKAEVAEKKQFADHHLEAACTLLRTRAEALVEKAHRCAFHDEAFDATPLEIKDTLTDLASKTRTPCNAMPSHAHNNNPKQRWLPL